MIEGCPDDDLFAKHLCLTVNGLNLTICTTYFHDLLGRDAFVKSDTLNRDFLAPIHTLPNFAKTTSPRDVLRILEFALDHQFVRQHPPERAQTLNLVSQAIPQGIRILPF